MLNITLAGRLGADATNRTTDSGDAVTAFNMAIDQGFGDRKKTYWFSVSMWGKRGTALAPHLRKGSSVTVVGELSTREHDGKTYLQCRANDITLQGGKPSEGGNTSYDDKPSQAPAHADLDDDLPF
jgi:single-strand DNA-binding protein